MLRANARVTPLQAVLRYRDLLQVEDLFRRAKAILRTRPIYHSSDAAIRGHVFCSFLALMLQKELADRCRASPSNGPTCCAISTACRRPLFPRGGTLLTAPTPARFGRWDSTDGVDPSNLSQGLCSRRLGLY